jgi:hypothetical protein
MNAFRQLSEYFISQAERLCFELMYGWEPEIHLSLIEDDLTDLRPGYSFISYPQNNFKDSYKDLLTRACTHRSGPLQELTGHGRWRWGAVREYLDKVKALDQMVAGGFLTACGQAPRIKGLFNIECENSPSSQRGILFWKGKMIYVIRHHKAKRSTNHEFNVARFLPARLAMVLTKSLVLIRRVASILRQEQQGYMGTQRIEEKKSLLFETNGKAWPTSYMTMILQKATNDIWQHKMNTRMYRQVTIGITEKHVREVHTPFNRYDDISACADLNMVFSWQSGHRPVQRGVTYGLDGAFPHQLQPSLLRAYEWASTRWHEFIHQPSVLHLKPGNPPKGHKTDISMFKEPTIRRGNTQSVYNIETSLKSTTGENRNRNIAVQDLSSPNQPTIRLPGIACRVAHESLSIIIT